MKILVYNNVGGIECKAKDAIDLIHVDDSIIHDKYKSNVHHFLYACGYDAPDYRYHVLSDGDDVVINHKEVTFKGNRMETVVRPSHLYGNDLKDMIDDIKAHEWRNFHSVVRRYGERHEGYYEYRFKGDLQEDAPWLVYEDSDAYNVVVTCVRSYDAGGADIIAHWVEDAEADPIELDSDYMFAGQVQSIVDFIVITNTQTITILK